MIFVCEPQCRGVSHEKVNSGFIYGLRLSFPNEKIRFYADESQLGAIKNILNYDEVKVDDIDYKPINFSLTDSPLAFLQYYFLFKNLFGTAVNEGISKIFFLSFTPKILYLIKRLKKLPKFKLLKFTFVLHGDFESIDTKNNFKLRLPIGKNLHVGKNNRSLGVRLQELGVKGIVIRILDRVRYLFKDLLIDLPLKMYKNWILRPFNGMFHTKDLIVRGKTKDFKFIALAPYIIKNANNHIDVNELQFYSIVLPTVFAAPLIQPKNDFIKFAIFGWGNPAVLEDINRILAKRVTNSAYEIRIIGSDSRGISQFKNVTCPSPGKWLSRSEMEKYVVDIDVFLVLYEKNRYRLSCSGSILEALSYMKPVFHLENDCIDFFNKKERPIGISCENVQALAETMEWAINNYEASVEQYKIYRQNILALRNLFSIENSLEELKASCTW